jgi:hypothetical protein
MTILFSFVSDKQAAVASDGNIIRNSDNMIVCNNHDKTFYLCNQMIVGAFSNNMSLDHSIYGKNVSIQTIISDISKNIPQPICFDNFVDKLLIAYENVLNSVETFGPSINNRSSNIILAASKHFDGKVFEIYCLRFTFNSNANKIILFKKEGPFIGNGAWYVDPPDEEFSAISDAIQQDFRSLPNGLSREQIVKRGIKIGINTSNLQKVNGKFLGGTINFKTSPL